MRILSLLATMMFLSACSDDPSPAQTDAGPPPVDCVADRPEYKASCEAAGNPSGVAYDERCETPKLADGGAAGGAPSACRATGNGTVVLICCP